MIRAYARIAGVVFLFSAAAACSNKPQTAEDAGPAPCASANPCDCCTAGDVCFDGQCCTPNCAGKNCGSDGCGGTCTGTCDPGLTCNPATGACECAAQDDRQFCADLNVVCGTATGADRCGQQRTVACDLCESPESCNAEKGACECVEPPDSVICKNLDFQCGPFEVSPLCAPGSRTIDCGTCEAGSICNGSNRCEICVDESDTEFCTRLGMQCGPASADDNCGQPRTAECGGCDPHSACNAATNACDPCTSESDADWCTVHGGLTCGTVDAIDSCNVQRTIACGSCTAPEWCDTDNLCKPCVAESDQTFCSRYARTCGPLAGDDNCNASRTVNECGPCAAASDTCDTTGNCVLCTPESDADLCAFYFKECGTPALVDNCGVPRTPNCGNSCPAGEACTAGVCTTGNVPLNATCNHTERIVLDTTGAANGTGDTTGASNFVNGYCGGGGNEVYYAFDIPSPKLVTITVTPSSASTGFIPLIYVRPSCGVGPDVACATTNTPSQPITVTTRAIPAGTWYLIVDQTYSSTDGAFTWSITTANPPPMPANDNCSNPEVLAFTNGVATANGNTDPAIGDFNDNCGYTTLDGPDLVYKFTLANPSAVTARVTRDVNSTSYYPAVELLSGCGPSANILHCGTQNMGSATAAYANLAAGDYYIVVDGGGGSSGLFELEVRVMPPVLNDLCSGAQDVPLTASPTSTDLIGSVQGDTSVGTDTDTSSCNSWGTGKDLAYSFIVPPGTAKNVLLEVVPASGSMIEPTLFVKDSCSSTSELACLYTASTGTTISTTLLRLVPGTYYVIIDGWMTNSNGPFTLNITASEPPPPPLNDLCARPEVLTLDASGAAHVSDTTMTSTNDYMGGCTASYSPHTGPDRVYAVDLPAGRNLSALVTRGANSASYRPAVYIQTTCNDTTTEVGCGSENMGMASASATNLVAGMYYIIVDGLSGSAGDFELDVVTYSPLTNDSCSSPELLQFDLNGDFVSHGDFCTVSNDSYSSGSGSCWGSGGGNDIVYKLVTTQTQTLEMTLNPGHPNASEIYLRTDCATAGSELLCSNQGSGPNHLKLKNLPAGTYYIWLDNGWSCGVFSFTAHLSNPPPTRRNDLCTTAEAVNLDVTSGDGSATGDTDAATGDSEASCRSGTGPELVYSFDLPGTRTVEITVTPQANSDLRPVVYVRNACTATSELLCKAASSSGAAALVQFSRLAAGTYYVYVDSWDPNASGPFDLQIHTITAGAQASNDLCASPIAMPAFDPTTHKTMISGNTVAGVDDDTSNCSTPTDPLNGADLVYTFTLPAAAVVNATVYRDAVSNLYRPALSIRSGCGRIEEVACKGEMSGNASITGLSLPAGTWYVFVDGIDSSYGGFNLEVEATAGTPVAGDNCGYATPLTFTNGTATASGDLTAGATNQAEEGCMSYTGNDLVYQFTTTVDKFVTVSIAAPAGGSMLKPVIALRRACDDLLSEAGCAYTWNSGGSATFTTGRLPAGTYWVYVDAYSSGSEGPFDLSVVLTDPVNPVAPNDACRTPITLNVGTGPGAARVTGDTRDSIDDYAGTCGSSYAPLSGGDVVYSLTLAQASTVVASVTRDSSTPNYLPAVYIRTGSCTSTMPSDERGCYSSGWSELSGVTANLPAGNYWIFVDGQRGTSGRFTLDVGVRTAPVSNDSCTAAQQLQPDINGLAVAVGDTSAGTIASIGSSSCYSNGPELYYSLTTNGLKDLYLEVVPGNSGYEPAVYVRSDCTDPMTVRACEYNYGGAPLKAMALRLPAGTYTIVVDTEFNSATGPFILRVQASDPPPPPLYDTCRNPQQITLPLGSATPLLITDSTLAGNNDYTSTCATANYPLDGPDLVYSFTLANAAQVQAKVTPKATSPNFKAAVYIRATCATTLNDRCSSATYSGGPSNPVTTVASLDAGTYYLFVDGVGGGAGDFDLEVSADTTRYVAGDHCLNATSIDSIFVAGTTPGEMVATIAGNNATATGDVDGSCNISSGSDLVYTFTVLRDSYVHVDLAADPGSSYYPYFHIRSTCTDPSTQLFCRSVYGSNPIAGGIYRVQAGTYFLFIDSYSSWSQNGGPFTAVVKVRDTPLPPLNDTCRGAYSLNFVSSGTGTGQSAQLLAQDSTFANNDTTGTCATASGNDVMYVFTLLNPQSFSATVTPSGSSPDFVPVLYLRSSCAQADDSYELTCAKPSGPGAATITANRLAPGTYYLYVDGYRGSQNDPPGGEFDIQASIDAPIAGPGNESCASVQTLVVAPAPSVTTLSAQTTVNAVDDTYSVCGASWGGPDVVYKIEVPTQSQIRVKVTPAGSFSPAVYLRHTCGSPGAGNQIACSESSGPVAVEATRSYVKAGTYFIWVDASSSAGANSSGAFDLEVALSVPTMIPPANDVCDPTIPVLSKGVAVTGTTVNAFNDYQNINGACGYWSIPGPEVVYAYTPATNGPIMVTLISSGADLMPWMAEAVCGDVNACVGANDSGGGSGGVDTFTYANGKAGVTYYIYVDSYMGLNTGAFTLTVN